MAQPQTVLASSNFLVPNATFIAEFLAFLIILAVRPRGLFPRID